MPGIKTEADATVQQSHVNDSVKRDHPYGEAGAGAAAVVAAVATGSRS